MSLPADMRRMIEERFAVGERERAAALVAAARLHDRSPADLRCRRCAVQAAHGSLEQLGYYLGQLLVDYRDVIVAGEYESRDGTLVRVRDLSQPFGANDSSVGDSGVAGQGGPPA